MESHVHLDRLGDGVWLIVVCGEHDLSTAPQLVAAFADIEEQGSVVVDFSDATFVDSTIVNVLFAQGKTPARRVVVVSRPGTSPRHTFELVALESLVDVYDTRDHALRDPRR